MSLQMQCRPLTQWPREYTKNRKRASFRSGYGDTLRLLESELLKIRAEKPFLELVLQPSEIRLDGFPRVGAEPSHPGVILWFERKGQMVAMPCDKYDAWRDNLRAIALSLKALRDVDRYGVTTKGEQYQGWTRLGAGDGQRFATKEVAADFLSRVLMADLKTFSRETCRREVEKRTHPDKGGSDEYFKAAQEALSMLGF